MASGGFLIKFDGKEDIRCAEATFGFDGWRYKTNGTDWAPLPKGIKTITLEVEVQSPEDISKDPSGYYK